MWGTRAVSFWKVSQLKATRMGRSPGRIPLIPRHEHPVSSQTAAVFLGSCEANILINLQGRKTPGDQLHLNMHKLQLFFLVDEFVLTKAPWAVEFLPQKFSKKSSRTMGVDFVRPASCEISIIRHPTRLRGPSWQGWILLQHCIIPCHPQHWRDDWDWLAVEVKPIDQTGKIPPGRSSQCRSFTSEVQKNMPLYDVPQEIPRSGFVCPTAVTQFSTVLQHPSVWYHFDRRHGPWYAFSD